MEMNMGKFSEKLVELLELAKKKKNVLEYQEINDFFKPIRAQALESGLLNPVVLSTETDALVYQVPAACSPTLSPN